MRIAFWNINQNTNSFLLDLLSEFSNSRKIDLLILLESRFSSEDVLLSVNRHEALFYYSPSVAFREDDYFQIEYYWYLFDQVLVRPSMLEEFDEKSLEIVTKIGKHKLLTPSSTIDETISDHLPVIFNLKIK
jgi:hypothetical protein